jgi:hypothetical protein
LGNFLSKIDPIRVSDQLPVTGVMRREGDGKNDRACREIDVFLYALMQKKAANLAAFLKRDGDA